MSDPNHRQDFSARRGCVSAPVLIIALAVRQDENDGEQRGYSCQAPKNCALRPLSVGISGSVTADNLAEFRFEGIGIS
jgi:hypothetical protein